MEGLRKIAKAHYQAAPEEVQKLAQDFFDAMDSNRDGQVSYQEFVIFMRQEGPAGMDNRQFFRLIDMDGNETLDFWEVMTLYYIVKSGRPLCTSCGNFITEIYFTCVDCFESPTGTFCLCSNCYPSQTKNHSHNGRCQFLDNYTLLQVKKVSAMNQRSQTPNARYTRPQSPSTGTYHVPTSNALVPVHQGNNNAPITGAYYVPTSNALVPAHQGNNNSQWSTALRVLEMALSIGGLAATGATLCTIL